MKKSKKILSSLLFSTTIACAGVGSFLFDFPQNTKIVAFAQETKYDEISNSLPDYFDINKSEDTIGSVDNNIFLFSGKTGENISLIIADSTIESTDKDSKPITNYGYYLDESDKSTYYYFDFSNNLQLYSNLTNDQLANGQTGTNLLDNFSITQFKKEYTATTDSESTAGIPNSLNFTPQQLNLSIKLGREDKIEDNQITLTEGCYTLRVPVYYQEMINGQAGNFVIDTIDYTFMLLNANSYFNEIDRLPNITSSKNMQENLIQGEGDFSKYYFHSYNATSAESTFTLPTLEFNPNVYQLTITYTDTDQNMKTTRIEYTESFTQFDQNDIEIDEEDYFVWTSINDGMAKIIFNNLGTYDIKISYLYKTTENDIYNLPLDRLPSTTFQNKLQRVYIYGYQAQYSDYNEISSLTNQPITKEFKTIDIPSATFNYNADITMGVNKTRNETASNPTNDSLEADELKVNALEYINTNALTPTSTNQTPVKFLSNVKVDSSKSGLYKLENTTEGWGARETTFSLLNQNTAGVYLYVIQYKYDNYIKSNGTTGKDDIHYQIFFFEVTNLTPSVSLYEETSQTETEVTTNELYTRGYTNKSVYIIDNSSKNPYDANVEITLSAYDYINKQYYFIQEKIQSFENGRFGIQYKTSFENINDTLNGRSGLYIPNTGIYANANFTIEIKSSGSTNPNITTFTIDTQKIEGITARKVTQSNSINYSIGETIFTNFTNESIIFSWDEKSSGAPTYGYLKFVPFQSKTNNYTNLSISLYSLLDEGILPVDYQIDMDAFNATSWVEYSNTNPFNLTVSASSVKQNSGFYLLEVFDDAGNVGYEIFVIDKTTPLFVKALIELDEEGNETGRSLSFINNGENIDVPEEANYKVQIQWADKGIYLTNFPTNFEIDAYAYSKDNENATESLNQKLKDFFDTTQTHITSLTGSYVTKGKYLKIEVNQTFYHLDENSYKSAKGKSYDIDLFTTDNNGEIVAKELSYSILIRDSSNTKLYGDESLNYKNAPSGMLNIRVSSDASKLDVNLGDKPTDNTNWDALQWSNYSFSGYLDTNGNPMGLKNSETQEKSENKYKYSYTLPTNDSKKLTLSYVPYANNGAMIESITLNYYPFTLKNEESDSYISGELESIQYYYYTIADKPTKSFSIYSLDEQNTPEKNEEFTFEIVLGSTNFPVAGKYVIERTYKDGKIGKYDFFKRTITFIVDPYNVISKIESIDHINSDETTTTFLESIVGGDILISMYSDKTNAQKLEIAFPRYIEGFNEGSFYSQSSFKDDEVFNNDLISISGNKLPLSLMIPQYKYTTKAYRDTDNNYIAINNERLIYYDIKIESDEYNISLYQNNILVETFNNYEDAEKARDELLAQIDVYELYAKIEFTPNGSTQVTERYHGGNIDAISNLNLPISENGYMKFYKQTSSLSTQSQKLEIETTPTTEFTEPGIYVVTLYQANNRGSSFNQLYSLYKFGFKIESNSPEFNIVDKRGYNLEEQNGNYYTNSSELTIQWEVPTSDYMAKIDETKIRVGENTIAPEKITGTGTRYFTIDLSELFEQMLEDPTKNYLDITMEFEGHDNKIYDRTTKRVYFDITAPHQNILALMQNVENSTMLNGTYSYLNTQILHDNAREYYNYNNEEISFGSGDAVSYSYIKQTGTLKKYYFNVDADFISSLTISDNDFDTKFIGLREIKDFDNFTPTTKDSFNKNNFISIEKITSPQGLYEIVECDWAGNITVYIVNVVQQNDSDTVLQYTNDSLESESTFTVKDMQFNGNNLYSNTGFEITSISYNNDGWETFSVARSDMTATKVYMLSPYGNVYMLNGSKFEPTSVTLASIFSDVESSELKHTIQFANRFKGDVTNLYLTIYNSTLITSTSYLSPTARLVIDIPSQSNLDSTTYGFVYPVKIKVEKFGSTTYTLVATARATEGLYGTWEISDNPSSTVSVTLENGKFSLNTIISNVGEKLKYTITDNFGNVTSIVHLANITDYTKEEIKGESNIYQVIESDASKTYVSNGAITLSYHTRLYAVSVYDTATGIESIKNVDYTYSEKSNIASLKFNKINTCYTIKIYDVDDMDEPLREVHIRLHDTLPNYTLKNNLDTSGGVTFLNRNLADFEKITTKTLPRLEINGKVFTNVQTQYISTYSSVVTMRYTNSVTDNGDNAYYSKNFPYSAYISYDNGENFEKLDTQGGNISSKRFSGIGDYIIIFVYDDENALTNEYKAYMVTILDGNSSPYTIMVDGVIVEKSTMTYETEDGISYNTNYLIGLDYSNKNRVTIIENEESNVKITQLESPTSPSSKANIEIYQFKNSQITGYFTIIYIKPPEEGLVDQFSYDSSGSSTTLLGKSNEKIIATEGTTTFDKLKLTFTSYYGIKTNKIVLKVEKMFNGNFIEVTPEITYSDDIATTYLTRAGYYRVSLHDSCEPANYQSFNGQNYMFISLLNYFPFSTTSTDSEGNSITTDPIQNAIYNSSVTLTLTDLNYGISSRPTITVYRNGKLYNKDNGSGHGYTEKNYSYKFSESGYYQVSFSSDNGLSSENRIKSSMFSFMIISKNESRSAFDYPTYSSYYITKIEKLGLGDVTEQYCADGDFDNKITINGKDYLTSLTLNYLDEKTGTGRYTITICPNEPAYESIGVKEFTFGIWINYSLPPINVSIGQGQSTTDTITIKFNTANFYEAVGDSYIKVGSNYYYINENTLASYSDIYTISITQSGTYFIQVYTANDQLIYSYKVIKNEPLNAFAIIAIVVGVFAFCTIIVITIKLRKRQKVK